MVISDGRPAGVTWDYDRVELIADAILHALTMTEDERRRRMQKMREAVAENNVYRWAGKFLSALMKFEFPETVPAGSGAAPADKRPHSWAA